MKKKGVSIGSHVQPRRRAVRDRQAREPLRTAQQEINDYREQLLKLKAATVPFKRVLSPGIRWLVAAENAPENEVTQQLAQLSAKGANIVLIMDALLFPGFLWKANTGTEDMTPRRLRKADQKDENKVKNAFRRLIEVIAQLAPVHPDTGRGQRVTERIARLLKEIRTLRERYEKDLQEYFDLRLSAPYLENLLKDFPDDRVFSIYPPDKIARMLRGKLKLTKHLWNESVVVLVDELLRIGFSRNASYEKTARLLHLIYPDDYKDTDRNLVRQRYTYHAKKLRPSSPRKK